MEYVAWLLCGMVVLIGAPIIRRWSRRRTNRSDLTFHPHQAADGSSMCFAMSLGRPYTDRTSSPDA